MDTTIVTAPDVDRRLRFHALAWWVLFILVVASWFAFGTLIFNRTDMIRGEAERDISHVSDKLNEATAFTQSRIDSRTTSLDARVDQLLRDNAMLRSQLSTLEAKYAAQEGICRTDCSTDK